MVKNGRHLERAGRVSSVRQREEGCHPSPRRRSVFPPLYLPLTRARSAESVRGVGEVEAVGWGEELNWKREREAWKLFYQ